jgi:hypothetical protein
MAGDGRAIGRTVCFGNGATNRCCCCFRGIIIIIITITGDRAIVNEPLWDGVGTRSPEIERARQERVEAARRALLDDYAPSSGGGGGGSGGSEDSPSMGRGDPLQDVLFGRGGIATTSSDSADDNEFPEGMDPRSFY